MKIARLSFCLLAASLALGLGGCYSYDSGPVQTAPGVTGPGPYHPGVTPEPGPDLRPRQVPEPAREFAPVGGPVGQTRPLPQPANTFAPATVQPQPREDATPQPSDQFAPATIQPIQPRP